MTEDEAFIRTIVDSPGRDLPRLVYADWLDDRDDPRGPFLRAEVEWAQPWKEGIRPGDPKELRAMATGLDPLWVARVSRPPVGVCCDHVGFEQRRPPTSVEALTALETLFALRLPEDYKAFLLNYNALWSDSAFYRHVNYSDHYAPLLYTFAVNTVDGQPYDGPEDGLASGWQLKQLDLAWRLSQIERDLGWPEMNTRVRRNFIPILCYNEEPDGEAGWLLLGVRGPNFGQIADLGSGSAEWDDPMPHVAPSFASFLANLVTTEAARPEWSTRRRLFE